MKTTKTIRCISAALAACTMLFGFSGCEKSDEEISIEDTIDIEDTSSIEATVDIEDTTSIEDTVDDIVFTVVDKLPKDPSEAIYEASPVGGNPKFYVFDEGMTFYIQSTYSENLYMCTITPPDIYSNCTIVCGRSGAGSGEAGFDVKFEINGEEKIVCYLFFCEIDKIDFYCKYELRDEELESCLRYIETNDL